MIPYSDDNPTRRFPVVTVTLMVLCIGVFIYQILMPAEAFNVFVFQYGLISYNLCTSDLGVVIGGTGLLDTSACVAPNPIGELVPTAADLRQPISAELTILSSMFMHGGWGHIIGNMIFLWVFGDNIEDDMGRIPFLVFYLICGFAAALTQFALEPSASIPMIGASGAISGVLGAYLLMYPLARVNTIVILVVIAFRITIPALLLLGFWFAGQLLQGYAADPNAPGVAFGAHIGGFVAGMVLHRLFGSPKPGWGRP